MRSPIKRTSHWLFVLPLLSVPFDVLASYRDGAAGVFFLMFSIPVAMVGFALTIIFAVQGRFRANGWLFPYFLFWAAIWLGVWIVISMPPPVSSDPETVPIIVIGEAVLVLIILLPAFIQSHRGKRATKTAGPAEPPGTA